MICLSTKPRQEARPSEHTGHVRASTVKRNCLGAEEFVTRLTELIIIRAMHVRMILCVSLGVIISETPHRRNMLPYTPSAISTLVTNNPEFEKRESLYRRTASLRQQSQRLISAIVPKSFYVAKSNTAALIKNRKWRRRSGSPQGC